MCLIVFAFKAHPDYRLILAANRDELHARPAEAMHWWPDPPELLAGELLAGRDLQAGGTWLGVGRSGRFAAVTNYREEFEKDRRGRSRGELVTGFVAGREAPLSWCRGLSPGDFRGFSLLTADAGEMVYVSNRGDSARRLEPGIYGLSNASLDTPWTKVVRGKKALQAVIGQGPVEAEPLFRLLGDREPAASDDYANTGLPPDMARAISAPFIATREYGTRCSTVLLWARSGRVEIQERRFDSAGRDAGDSRFEFTTERVSRRS
jgi:uncharacterized protein with NRDE domain